MRLIGINWHWVDGQFVTRMEDCGFSGSCFSLRGTGKKDGDDMNRGEEYPCDLRVKM